MIYLVVAALLISMPKPIRRLDTSPWRPRVLPPGMLVMVLVGVATFLILVIGRISVVVAGFIASLTVTHLFTKHREAKKLEATERSLEYLLGHVSADVRAGSLPAQAFARAVDDLPTSTPSDVRSVLLHAGRGGHEVLAGHPALEPIAKVWALSHTHGLPTAELFNHSRTRLSANLSHRGRTKASLTGPQATSYILAGLPLAGLLLGSSMGADPIGFLSGGGIGGVMLIVGVALICGGLIISQIITERASS